MLVKSAWRTACGAYRLDVVFPGRALCLTAAKGHGTIQVFVVYLPGPNDASGAPWRAVIEAIAAHSSDGALTILTGNWNFVDSAEDRVPGGLETHDLRVSTLFCSVFPDLTEVGDSCLHAYTHYGGRSSSRIDRVWISSI